jgi:hypothetical protein
MSKYFTKYLNETGEIGVGDYVRSESSGRQRVKVTGIDEDGNYITDERDWHKVDSYFVLPKKKAVKVSTNMYLCTKDINIGDKVKHTAGYPFVGYAEFLYKHDWLIVREEANSIAVEKRINTNFNVYVTAPTYNNGAEVTVCGWNLYKVVGIISPDAIWVKEGNTFTEEDIHRCFSGDALVTGTVKIKCPTCKTFH